MPKSTPHSSDSVELARVTTYQTGVVQSTAFRVLKKQTTLMLREHDLTMTQWFLIGTIYDAGDSGISATKLARTMGTGIPFITNSINLLESRGIVVRTGHETDSRSKMVAIAPAYRKRIPVIEEDLRNKMRDTLYSKITREELTIYIKVLYLISTIKT